MFHFLTSTSVAVALKTGQADADEIYSTPLTAGITVADVWVTTAIGCD